MTEARPDANPKSAFGMTKPPLHLVPSTALVRAAMVMKLGAQKYGAYNWRDAGVAATIYVSAAERHLRAWLDGQDVDPESGQSHLAHMVACGLILLDAIECDKFIDDRPPPARTGDLLQELIEKPPANTEVGDDRRSRIPPMQVYVCEHGASLIHYCAECEKRV